MRPPGEVVARRADPYNRTTMPRLRPISMGLVSISLAFTLACSEPPTKEMNQAQGAIDAARSAGAERYAPDEYKAAAAALERSKQSVTERDYRSALNFALDARERARDAARAGADRMAQARGEAEQALHTVSLARQTLQERVDQAVTARVPERTIAEARTAMTDAGTALQEARSAVERQDYAAARATAAATSKTLNTTIEALNTALEARGARRPVRRTGR
jgi:Domain of unknown function (DUF4398)